MNLRIALAGLILLFSLTARAQVTINPRIDQSASQEVRLTRVELAGPYTILTFEYRIGAGRRQATPNLPPELRKYYQYLESEYTSTISFRRASRLVVNVGGGTRSFRFIKAQGIPTDPERLQVKPGDEGQFHVYFERLEPGMQVFDLFECRSDDNYTCWNYTGIHVNNPATRRRPPPRPRVGPPIASPAPPVAGRPRNTVTGPITVSGQIFDAVTKQAIDAKIVYQANGRVADSTRTIHSLGIYRLTLPGGQYKYTASAPGYEASSEALDLTQPVGLTQVDRDIFLKPVGQAAVIPPPATPKPPVANPDQPLSETPPVVGRKVELKNVLFEASKAALLSDSYATLDELAQWMKDNSNVEIRLEGHTDRLGDPQRNLQLSVDRVVAVKRYLTNKGIAATRIQTRGYGDKRPLSNATSEEERRKNRRVEFVIVKS
ncbi:MAG: OmpA family protein [Cytophagaceae bacterium]|nr:OmpA family protein [Cytophagaceae bacterium]